MIRKKQHSAYGVWASMIQRCCNSKRPAFAKYGAVGIGVCDRWRSFENFAADMGEKPHGLTLERIDNSKGYSFENCKWATRKEQALNRNMAFLIEYQGITKNESIWCSEKGFKSGAIRKRLKRGWTIEQAMTLAVGERV